MSASEIPKIGDIDDHNDLEVIAGRDEDAISIGSPSNLMIDDEDLPELVELECNSEPTEVVVEAPAETAAETAAEAAAEAVAEAAEGEPMDQTTLSGPEAEPAVEADGEESKNPVRQADPVDQFHQELQALAKPPKRVIKSQIGIPGPKSTIIPRSESAKDIRGRQSFWDKRDEDERRAARERERQEEDRRAKERYDQRRRERESRDRQRSEREDREDREYGRYYNDRSDRSRDRYYDRDSNRGADRNYERSSDRNCDRKYDGRARVPPSSVNYRPRERVVKKPSKPEKIPIAHVTPLPVENMAAMEEWWSKLASQDPHPDDFLAIPGKYRRDMSKKDLKDYWSKLVLLLERTVRSDLGARVTQHIKTHYRQIIRHLDVPRDADHKVTDGFVKVEDFVLLKPIHQLNMEAQAARKKWLSLNRAGVGGAPSGPSLRLREQPLIAFQSTTSSLGPRTRDNLGQTINDSRAPLQEAQLNRHGHYERKPAPAWGQENRPASPAGSSDTVIYRPSTSTAPTPVTPTPVVTKPTASPTGPTAPDLTALVNAQARWAALNSEQEEEERRRKREDRAATQTAQKKPAQQKPAHAWDLKRPSDTSEDEDAHPAKRRAPAKVAPRIPPPPPAHFKPTPPPPPSSQRPSNLKFSSWGGDIQSSDEDKPTPQMSQYERRKANKLRQKSMIKKDQMLRESYQRPPRQFLQNRAHQWAPQSLRPADAADLQPARYLYEKPSGQYPWFWQEGRAQLEFSAQHVRSCEPDLRGLHGLTPEATSIPLNTRHNNERALHEKGIRFFVVPERFTLYGDSFVAKVKNVGQLTHDALECVREPTPMSVSTFIGRVKKNRFDQNTPLPMVAVALLGMNAVHSLFATDSLKYCLDDVAERFLTCLINSADAANWRWSPHEDSTAPERAFPSWGTKRTDERVYRV